MALMPRMPAVSPGSRTERPTPQDPGKRTAGAVGAGTPAAATGSKRKCQGPVAH